MHRFRLGFFWVAPVAALFWILITPIPAYSASPAAVDTVFTAIDMTTVSLSRGVEPSPFILWHEANIGWHHAWLFTLNSQTGAQMGMRTTLSFLVGDQPVAALWSRHLLDFPARGVEPSPFIIFRNYRLRYYTVMYDFDGTPTIEISHSQLLDIDPIFYGYPTCMAELPGIAFSDGLPRLCIGTDSGYLILMINTFVAGITVDQILRPAAAPISDLEPIPQYGYISLGVLTGNMILGYKFLIEAEKPGGDRYLQVYTIEDPRLEYTTDFDVFDAQDEPLPDISTEVALVLANGTTEVARAHIGAVQTGALTLDPEIELHNSPIQAVTAGSLLMLLSDGSGIRYDPAYSPETGPSGCDINITDGVNDDCAIVCGDANGDWQVNVGDAVYVISYVFKGGPAPDPVCAGDANGDSSTNVADAVYLINYVFKGGPPPPEGCCP